MCEKRAVSCFQDAQPTSLSSSSGQFWPFIIWPLRQLPFTRFGILDRCVLHSSESSKLGESHRSFSRLWFEWKNAQSVDIEALLWLEDLGSWIGQKFSENVSDPPTIVEWSRERDWLGPIILGVCKVFKVLKSWEEEGGRNFWMRHSRGFNAHLKIIKCNGADRRNTEPIPC